MDIETSAFNINPFNEIDNFDFLLENEFVNTASFLANLSSIETTNTISNNDTNSDFDFNFLLNNVESLDQNSNSPASTNNESYFINDSPNTNINTTTDNNNNDEIIHDELIAEMLLSDFNSFSSVPSNVPSPSSSSSVLSPASNNSNDNDKTSIAEIFAEPASKIIVIEKHKKSNEIILNINDIGMECIKSKTKSNANNESCIELETEYDSDEDVRPDKKLELTDEEKSLFLKEGYEIPKHLPLTKNEEKILKLIRRKIRNKQSAHLSRERKKHYVDGLEKRVDLCTKENQKLHKEIKQLKEQNFELVSKLQKMQTCLVALLNKSNKAKLSTTILFLSFFMTFCVYPLFDSKSNSSVSSIQVVPYTGGNSRTLMSTDDNYLTLPNETKNGFFDNISNKWDPYNKYRYDI